MGESDAVRKERKMDLSVVTVACRGPLPVEGSRCLSAVHHDASQLG